MTEKELCKKLLVEFLGFLQHKVESDTMTLEEEMALARLFEKAIPLLATAEDLAAYYGKTPVAIRSIIHRKMLGKPKRRVMYDFREFARIIPDKWKK